MCMVRDHGRNEFSFPEYRMIKSIQDARRVKKGVPIICSALNKYVACSYWFGGQSGLLPHYRCPSDQNAKSNILR